MSKLKFKFNFSKVILFIILVIFIALRFYNIDKKLPFGWDQEQFSTQIYNIIVDHRLTLLGPRVNNDLGFFLAPYFTYLLVPFYYFSNLSPSVLGIFLFILNIIFFFSTYFVLSKIFSEKHALWFLAFWSVNPIMQVYDSSPWWPVFIPLGVITIWYLLYRIYKNSKNLWLWALIGLALGFFTNMHIQFILLSFIIASFLFLERKRLINIKGIALAFFSFCFMFLPILLFDVRHGFLNAKLLFPFIGINTTSSGGFSDVWFPVFANVMSPLTFTKNVPIIFIIVLIFCITLFKTKRSTSLKGSFNLLTLITIVLTFLVFSFYSKRPSEYYFIYLIPFLILSLVDLFISHKKEFILALYLFLVVIFNFGALRKNVKPIWNGLYIKEKIVKELKSKVNDSKIVVSFFGGPDADGGFRYLLKLNNVNVSSDNRDPQVEIGFPPKKDSVVIGEWGIKIPDLNGKMSP